MSREFTREVKTIHLILKGSRWAREPDMPAILDEYERMSDAGALQSREKRTALQILFSSRAIDSFLAMVIKWEHARQRMPVPPYSTIEKSLGYLASQALMVIGWIIVPRKIWRET